MSIAMSSTCFAKKYWTNGAAYGLVLSGRLGVQLGFERHELGPGDSIGFDSTVPHRLWNAGDEPVQGVWFVVGRDGS